MAGRLPVGGTKHSVPPLGTGASHSGEAPLPTPSPTSPSLISACYNVSLCFCSLAPVPGDLPLQCHCWAESLPGRVLGRAPVGTTPPPSEGSLHPGLCHRRFSSCWPCPHTSTVPAPQRVSTYKGLCQRLLSAGLLPTASFNDLS